MEDCSLRRSSSCAQEGTDKLQACLDKIVENDLEDLSTALYVPAAGGGSPTSYTFRFQDDGSQGTARILSILDGAGDGYRLASVRIRLNGAEAVAPNEITLNTDWLDKAVTLQGGTHTLELENLSTTSGSITLVVATETRVP